MLKIFITIVMLRAIEMNILKFLIITVTGNGRVYYRLICSRNRQILQKMREFHNYSRGFAYNLSLGTNLIKEFACLCRNNQG